MIVNVPSFMVKVSKLLNETDPVVLTNYVMWRVVLQSICELPKLTNDYLLNFVISVLTSVSISIN